MRALLVSIAAATLVVASCSSDAEREPVIRIVSPQSGSVVNETSVLVTIEVERFTLSTNVYDPPADPFGDTPAKPFFGHWHLYSLAPGAGAFQIEGDQLTAQALLPGLTEGHWVIAAELVNENHVPVYSVPVEFVEFDVPANLQPSITIVAPGEGDPFFSSSIDVQIAVENFTVDSAAVGQPNAPGTGHWHLVTGSAFTATFVAEGLSLSTKATDLSTEGTGSDSLSLWAVLANNDHTLIDPPVFDEVGILLPGDAPRIHLLDPAPGATVTDPFDAFVSVHHFTLVDPAVATVDSAGQGHWHVLIDGADQGVHAFTTSALGISIGAGTHDVTVELRTNTHAPVAPQVIDVSTVTR